MKLTTVRRALVAGVALGAAGMLGATAEAKQPTPAPPAAPTAVPITSGAAYDRNPAVVQDGATTWLFFARSEEVPCDRLDGCNADNTDYDLYYQQSTDGGATWGAAVQLADNDAVPRVSFPDFRGRTVSAARSADGTLTVAWSPGGHSGTLALFQKAPSSSTWTTTYVSDTHFFNVDVAAQGNTVHVVAEMCCDRTAGVYHGTFSGGTLSPMTLVFPDMSIPKLIVDNAGVLRMTMVSGSDFSDYVASSANGSAWTAPTLAAPNATPGAGGNWDPNLVQTPDGRYHLHYAPGPFSGENQRIEVVTSTDFVTWSAPTAVTSPANYWDYWPEAIAINGTLRLFYTSEAATSSGGDIGTGHIWSLGTQVLPTNKDQCKNGGWAAFGFRNQGQCVSSVK
jgi:hypothetical protein